MNSRHKGDVYTLSALSDKLVKVFESVKREQPYMKLNVIAPGDYYYFSFLASVYNQRPLEMKAVDVSVVLEHYPNIEMPVLKSCIDLAITKFAENNGFGVYLDRLKKNEKYQWRITQ